MVGKNKIGLVVGLFFAIVHAIWAILVFLTPSGLQKFVDWIIKLHLVDLTVRIQPFNLTNAITLVAITFLFGYFFGWLFAALLNCVMRQPE